MIGMWTGTWAGTSRARRGPHRGFVALVAVLTLTVLAGCGGADEPAAKGSSSSAAASASPSASASGSPSPTASASESVEPQAAEIEAVKSDYRQYITAYFTAYGAADAEVAKLIEYSAARRQAKHRSDVAQMRQTGFRLKGTPPGVRASGAG